MKIAQQPLWPVSWRVPLVLSVAFLLWLPRGLGLDRYATADENAWLTRSANFYRALSHSDWGGTFQRHHPGVTLTWSGTLGFLAAYPDYVNDTNRDFGWIAEELTPFLREHGHEPVALLAAGRSVAVLVIVLALTLTFVFAWRLWGVGPALVGSLLLAFDPFHIAHSRLLHLDGLLSSFLILALVGLLVALRQTEQIGWRRGALVVAGVAAGLAWLTRSPGFFLLPFAGLLGLLFWADCLRRQAQQRCNLGKTSRLLLLTLAVWGMIGGATFFVLWPAMWVDPWGSLGEVFSAANEYATEGHADPIFFNGTVYNGDPGFWFYPVSWLWRVTPVVLIGLVLRVLGLRSQPDRQSALIRTRGDAGFLALLLMALLFTLFMDLGAKKFDRYLLPVYPALDLAAGWGLVGAAVWVQGWLRRWWSQRRTRAVVAVAVTLFVVAQALLALPHYPYYLTYYNPLLGGSRAAPGVMQIGRGEGAELAAQFLDHQSSNPQSPTHRPPTVASSFPNGPFSYFYGGRTVPHTFWTVADYAVVYAQDFQRRMPSPRQIAWVERLTPLERINLHGIEYAHIYDLRRAPIPAFVTTWAQGETAQIRLNAYELTAGIVQPGEAIRATFYLENLAPIADDLNVLVRLVGADGSEIARAEGWSWGAPTSRWPVNEIRPDGHTLQIPETAAPGLYRLEIGFYAPESQATLPAVQANTGDQLPDLVPLDFIQVGALPVEPAVSLDTPVQLGDWVTLLGYTTETSTGRRIDVSRTPLLPGEDLELTLFWQVQRGTEIDYTTFVHVVDSNGTLLTQQDQPPTAGFLPTSLWRTGQIVADRYTLAIPEGAALGTYQIHVGLYDLTTLARLPVTQGDGVTGDSVPLTQLVIALSGTGRTRGR